METTTHTTTISNNAPKLQKHTSKPRPARSSPSPRRESIITIDGKQYVYRHMAIMSKNLELRPINRKALDISLLSDNIQDADEVIRVLRVSNDKYYVLSGKLKLADALEKDTDENAKISVMNIPQSIMARCLIATEKKEVNSTVTEVKEPIKEQPKKDHTPPKANKPHHTTKPKQKAPVARNTTSGGLTVDLASAVDKLKEKHQR